MLGKSWNSIIGLVCEKSCRGYIVAALYLYKIELGQ
jgi:hypothetical protein